MSGLCGWFDRRHADGAGGDVIAAMAVPLSRFDASPLCIASANFGSIAAAGANGDVDVFQNDNQLVAVWGSARFTDVEFRGIADRNGVAQALAQGYRSKGTNVLTMLSGSFALAILHGATGEAVLAIDRMGSRPLCYSATTEKLVFGSTLDAIHNFTGRAPEVDPQSIYDYVYFHMVPAPLTINAGHRRLLPGSYVRWHDGRMELRAYWQMRYLENETRSFPELKSTFRAVLRESVREAAAGGTVGTFLSGGTDSSTIAGMLRDVTGQPPRTYSIGFDAKGYDEMDYARIAARHFGTRHHEYYVTADDVVAAIPQIAAIHDQPYGNASAVPTFYCAKLAKEDGIDTLLGGDGGDELFGGNDRYAKQYLYSLYSDLPGGLRRSVVEPVVFLPPALGIAGKLQRYIRHASQPMPARYDNHNLIEHLGPGNVFTPDFLSQVDVQQPQALMMQAYREAHADSLINRMLAFDLRFTLADNDLPKVTRSCELARIEVRFPMLNDALVDFSARLRPHDKLKRTKLRYFFKEALRDYLPHEIIVKRKHGFGLPFGRWFVTHRRLQQIAFDSLTDLKQRHIVRAEFIDELTSRHVKSHVEYYGTMVWVLMMLEQWFKLHPPRASTNRNAPRAEANGVDVRASKRVFAENGTSLGKT